MSSLQRVRFRIVRLIVPASYDAIFDGYTIAMVHLLQPAAAATKSSGSKSIAETAVAVAAAKEYKFKGILPSCRPYFIFEAPVEYIKATNELHLRDSDFAKVRVERVFDNVMLHHIKQYELRRGGTAIRPMLHMIQCLVLDEMQQFHFDASKVDTSLVEDVPMLNEVFRETVEYWRLPHAHEIMMRYTATNPKRIPKMFSAVRNLTFQQLLSITSIFKEDPIQCCWHSPVSSQNTAVDSPVTAQNTANSPVTAQNTANPGGVLKYCLNYEAFGALVKQHSLEEKYSPMQHLAVRLLDFFRRQIAGKLRSTAMLQGVFKRKYLDTRCYSERIKEEPLFEEALTYLSTPPVAQLVCVSSGKVIYVTLPKFFKTAKCIVGSIFALSCSAKATPAAELLRNTDVVPCIPKQLTDEQTEAGRHILNSPLTVVMGPPGRGKTCLIEFAMALWEKVCVVSFVGTVVAGHRRRMNNRLECSNTAHHVYRTCAKSPEGAKWTSAFDELVWDEFSNVKDSLFCNTLSALPSLKRLVLVLDPRQIQPIGKGSPALDIIDAFPRDCFMLTANMRVNPRSRELADAIIHVMQNKPERIEWSYDPTEKASMTIVDALADDRSIRALLEYILKNKDTYQVRHVMDVQFIAFTNKLCRKINRIVESAVRDLGLVDCAGTHGAFGTAPGGAYAHTKEIRVNSEVTVYPGCKICIVKENFDEVPKSRLDAVRNGECGVVVSCTVCHDNPLSTTPDGGTLIVWNTGGTTQKRMFLNKNVHVDPACVQLGHCITANKAQALEYNTVIGVLDDDISKEQWVYNSHLYVMASRAKEAFFLIGKGAESRFRTICARMEPRRTTILLPLLRTINEPFLCPCPRQSEDGEDSKNIKYDQREHNYELDEDKETPCVPALCQYKQTTEFHKK